jgi:streptogramin lyase
MTVRDVEVDGGNPMRAMFCALIVGCVLLVSPSSSIGQFTTYPVTLQSPPYWLGSIAAGPDGNLWFVGQGNLIKITPQGVMTTIVARSAAGVLAMGIERRIWFSVMGALGVVNADDSITYHRLPTTKPIYSFAVGSDGREWFSEAVGRIGAMTANGVVTTYPVFRPDWHIGQLVEGSDGNIWFGLERGRVEKVTTSGVFTTYLLPNGCGAGGLGGAVAGRDGNIWMGGWCPRPRPTNVMVRITTAGAMTFYPVANGMGSLVAVSRSAIWGSTGSNDILRFNPLTGSQSAPIHYPVRSQNPSGTSAMTDAFGNLWLTSYAGDDPNSPEIVEYVR